MSKLSYHNSEDVLVVAREAGLPEWLIHLRDRLFENLPDGEREEFHFNLYEAIPVGVDLEPVRHQLAILRMDRLIEQERGDDDVVAVLKLVRDGHQSELKGERVDWSAARRAARRAAQSADWIADRRAANSAAWSAGIAANSAAWSAGIAANSAARSAKSAARSAAYRRERDDLLKLLRAAGRQ